MKLTPILLSAVTLGCLASQAQAALTVYTTRAAWEAAVGGTFTEENFDTYTVGTSYESSPVDVGDFTVGVSGSTFGFSFHNIGPDAVGNNVNGTPQINAATGETGGTTLTFDTGITAFGANWAGISDSRTTSIDVGGMIVEIPNLNGEFWGFVSDAPFTSPFLFLSSGAPDGFGIDNVVFATAAPNGVSEPGSLSIVALSLFALAAMRRRKA